MHSKGCSAQQVDLLFQSAISNTASQMSMQEAISKSAKGLFIQSSSGGMQLDPVRVEKELQVLPLRKEFLFS